MTPDAPVSRPRPMAGTMKPPRTRQIVRAQRNSGAGRGKRVAKSWVPRTTGLQFGGVTLSHQLAKLAGSFRAIVWRVRHPKGEMRWAFEYFRMWHVRHYREEPRARDGRGAGTYTVEASADVILTVTRCDRPDGTPRAAICRSAPEHDGKLPLSERFFCCGQFRWDSRYYSVTARTTRGRSRPAIPDAGDRRPTLAVSVAAGRTCCLRAIVANHGSR
jgi:hypothetical protein